MKAYKNRKALKEIYHHLYERHYMEQPNRCFYCDEPMTCLDHVPPLSSMEGLNTAELRRYGIPMLLIPACTDCNTMLGDRHLLTVAERLDYLENKLARELDKKFTLWSEDEINELGPSLQNVVRAKQRKLRDKVSRLRKIQERIVQPDTHPIYTEPREIWF